MSDEVRLLLPTRGGAPSVEGSERGGARGGQCPPPGVVLQMVVSLGLFLASLGACTVLVQNRGTRNTVGALLGEVMVADASEDGGGGCALHGFADELPSKLRATTVLRKVPERRAETGTDVRAEGTTVVRCTRELMDLPVVKTNDAYRLGNAVERQGVGWIAARRLVLENESGYRDSILFDFLMGANEEQRAFVGCVVAHKRRLERARVDPARPVHGDNSTIVIPLRLSDKVRFLIEDYPVVNEAIVAYKKTRCPWCDKLVIATLLVWGEDENHMFAYTYDEYVKSISVLHAVARVAQSPEGGGLDVSIRSSLNADADFIYSAYSPHLVLPMTTPSSWNQLLTYTNRAVFDPRREAAALGFYDKAISPKLTLTGRRQRLLNAYARLESLVPETRVLSKWFQSEVKRRGLKEHEVTVMDMLTWRNWPAIVKPYVVGMKAYDQDVRSLQRPVRALGGQSGRRDAPKL